MALLVVTSGTCDEEDCICLTSEPDPARDDAALEWVTSRGFCVRMRRDVAARLTRELRRALGAEPDVNEG